MKSVFHLLIFLFLSSIATAAPTTSWRLDELGNSSSPYVVEDSISASNGIAYNMPTTGNAAGKVCSAYDLTASSVTDYALLDESTLDGVNDFTISIWHKGSSGASHGLLSGARTGRDNELLMWFGSSTSFSAHLDGTAYPAITFPSINNNVWHHLVWRRAGNQSCLFIDGVQQGCKTVTTKTMQIESLILGQDQDNVGGGFDINQDWEGKLDELLIFRNALNNAEILSIYNNQNAGNNWNGTARTCPTTPPDTPPVDSGYSDWHFDEASWNGTANEVVDSHGTNHGIGYSVSAVPGKICNGMDLRANSTADYAKLGAASLDGVDDFTVSVWHKGSSANGRSLLSAARSGQYNEAIMWFSNATTFNGHLKGSSLGGLTINNLADNAWHHFVWKRTGGSSCFYMDSTPKGCQPTTKQGTLSISSLVLGQEQDTLGGGFQLSQDWEGIVDELIIFRRSLSDAEITSIYNNQNNGRNWDGGYRACPDMPAMKLSKTSVVISDPANNTNNPKRIPGAIIRYTITAINEHATAAEGVIIKDDLTEEVGTLGNIAWNSNITVKSPNINGGAVTALTDVAGDDQGEFIGNKLAVSCGNITNSAPCIVTYDVEVTQ